MLIASKLYIANLALTLLCATALAIITIANTSGTVAAMAVVIVLILFLCQLTLARFYNRQQIRTDRYHRLGRKLLQLKRTKKRDESMAFRVLNHIVQQSSVPSHTEIWHEPLETFSGDLALATHSDNGTSYTLIADLTGHGIAAAMGATPVASIFQATARRGMPIEQIMVELNEKLRQLLPSGYFCCASIVSCHNGHVKVCNAGLPPVKVVNADGTIAEEINSEQLPLGIDKINEKDVIVFSKSFDADARLYAFTDGLIEATNPDSEQFGESGLDSIIQTNCPSNGRIGLIKEGFSAFVKGSTQSDDISIVEVNIC